MTVKQRFSCQLEEAMRARGMGTLEDKLENMGLERLVYVFLKH